MLYSLKQLGENLRKLAFSMGHTLSSLKTSMICEESFTAAQDEVMFSKIFFFCLTKQVVCKRRTLV